MPEERKTRNKPTKEEHEQRIQECMRLLRRRSIDGRAVTVGIIKKLFKEKYGSYRATVERYIAKAQDRIVQESGLSKATHKALTGEFLNQIIGDANEKTPDRLAANRQYMDLYGLAVSPKSNQNDGGLQQHLHLHSDIPLTIEQRKQALLERFGIGAADQGGDDGRGVVESGETGVIEVARRESGGSGPAGRGRVADGEGMEVGVSPDAGE